MRTFSPRLPVALILALAGCASLPAAAPVLETACEKTMPADFAWICTLTAPELDARIAKARDETPAGRMLAEVPAISRHDKEKLLARMLGAPGEF